ncbi:protein prenylyltransferase [Teratosphaeria nubilosa]|uniref:Geranylgeranyl transferase type-2 subunit alpha n=1 Tax=Teratosphaeria nubilosa TaxID=161662 RepID=A0A6G1L5R2_9PEZI|nr:protein prenylyltransferase [Teratosphaeria nubilosa]
MASHGIPRVSGNALDKSDAAKEKEQKQIEAYKTLEKDVVDRIKAQDYSNTTFQLTSRLLTQNPEYYTVWNYRRLLLQDVFANELSQHNNPIPEEEGTQDADQAAAVKAGQTPAQREITLLIEEDLRFLIPLLKQFPKCYWIWNHRSWLLAQATKHLPTHTATQLWKGELGLVSKMLALDSRNFHGWGYRREVVESIEKLSGKSMVEDEFGYTTKMINTNLSNFSAWHYRSQLISRLLELRKASSEDRKTFFDSELELITNALWTDPYDQSLWFYHQYLLATLDPDNAQASSILEPCSNEDRVKYLEREIGSIREMMHGAEDCKYMYQALLEYSRRYLDLEAGNGIVNTKEMSGWLKELKTRDPLRTGRWSDLESSMKL